MNKKIFDSVSVVRQGKHAFYSFTMPADVLASCCYVINRDEDEDPEKGFQRELDKKRAKEIASYIDSGFGTIPSSIVLSAQSDCNFTYDSKKKSISFDKTPKAFLIIDGQHRVYGFKFAKTALDIPVVVYENLSKRDESRLVIDINSKQRGVPTPLLLDIKKMAEHESDTEEYLKALFNAFSEENDSALYNRLSSVSKRVEGKITRAVFNTTLKPLVKTFRATKSTDEIYSIYNAYLIAFIRGILAPHNLKEEKVYNTTIFKAMAGFFPIITVRVKDRFGPLYTVDNFYEYTRLIGRRIKVNKLDNPTNAYKPIVDHLEKLMNMGFTL